MIKRLFAIMALALTFSAAQAKSVVITLNDGTLVYYLLGGEKNPMLRFKDGHITMDADTYQLSDIKNFYISATDDPNTGIADKEVAATETSFKNGVFVVKGIDCKNVKVFTIDGKMTEASVNAAGDNVSIDLSGLEQGTYVISIGKTSFKVLKK